MKHPTQEQLLNAAIMLEQYDLEQSPDYRKGWDDGRKKGYEVGHRHGLEQHLFNVSHSAPAQQPLFWYRPRSDGGYEGPIHNDQIEQARRESGAWVPLGPVAMPATIPAPQLEAAQALIDQQAAQALGKEGGAA